MRIDDRGDDDNDGDLGGGDLGDLHNQAPYPVDPVLVDRLGEEEGVAGDRCRREAPLNLL